MSHEILCLAQVSGSWYNGLLQSPYKNISFIYVHCYWNCVLTPHPTAWCGWLELYSAVNLKVRITKWNSLIFNYLLVATFTLADEEVGRSTRIIRLKQCISSSYHPPKTHFQMLKKNIKKQQKTTAPVPANSFPGFRKVRTAALWTLNNIYLFNGPCSLEKKRNETLPNQVIQVATFWSPIVGGHLTP